MLRAHGVPARARCGFGAYFEKGKFIDHWVSEYWNAAQRRWILVDAQLDERQRELFRIAFDPQDVPRDRFLVAGDAWRRCRAGEADPQAFGILDMHGLWFIAGSFAQCRIYSKYLALQIKASEAGLLPRVGAASDAPSVHRTASSLAVAEHPLRPDRLPA